MATHMACLDIVQALQAPRETTIARLLSEYELSTERLLDAYAALDGILTHWKVVLEPKLGIGGLDDVRVLRSLGTSELREIIDQEIAAGEGQRVEFKQTLALDIKKHELGGKPVSECFSDDVVMSAMKTVAAFLNSGGGTLLIGVKDDGTLTSLECEFPIVCPKGNATADGWELRFRGLVEQYFVDGISLQPYIQIQIDDSDGHLVARVVVGHRGRLSFIAKSELDYLFLRVGNRTQSVKLRQIEEFFDLSVR